jgi:hypothetical protein
MRRRAFLGAIVALVATVAAQAQQRGKIPRVGVIRPGDPPPGDFGHQEAFEGASATSGGRRGPRSSSSTGTPKASPNACPSWRPSWFGYPWT